MINNHVLQRAVCVPHSDKYSLSSLVVLFIWTTVRVDSDHNVAFLDELGHFKHKIKSVTMTSDPPPHVKKV